MSFDRAVDIVLDLEGLLSDDAQDSGGLTKYGIAQNHHPTVDVASLKLEDAKRIYRVEYWDAARCFLLPWPLSLYVFDAAVNQGVRPAVVMLQRTLGVKDDGIVGPKTVAAAEKAGKEQQALYLTSRVLRYVATSKWSHYGRGWAKRLFRLVQEA